MCHYETLKSVLVTRGHSQPVTDDDQPESAGTENSRELLEIAADTIIAVFHEPAELGLSENQAIEMATGILDEALNILSEVSPAPFKVSGISLDEATTENLNQAACLLKSIADQL
jgi:hypothetical protein